MALAPLAVNQPAAQVVPDTVYYNGKIVTVNDGFDIVEAVAIRDGRFVAVGSNEEVRSLATGETQLVDLQGQTVLLGFVDNHVHPGPPLRLAPSVVDLRHAYTWEENATRLRQRVESLPPGEWIYAYASRLYFTDDEPPTPWFDDDPYGGIPDRWDLDEVAPNHPVVVRASQIVVANSLALTKAGITRDSREPVDGAIIRDSAGEPNGILWYSVGDRVENLVPEPAPPTPLTPAQTFSAYTDFFRDLVALGITSVNIAGSTPEELRLYQNLQERWQGRLPRMTVQVGLSTGHTLDGLSESLETLEGYGWRTGAGDNWLKLGAIKMYLDGGYTFSRPWPINSVAHKHVPGYYGGWRSDPELFYQTLKRGHDLGWQLGLHLAGDEGSRVVVDMFERILEANPRQDHRHHIIHFEVPPPDETFHKMERLGIGVALQPNFTYGLQPFFSMALSGEQLERNNPSRSILDHGLHMSYGSDERPYGPLVGLYAQVTRRGVDGRVYGPEEAVTLEEAIRAYTMGSAWHTFDENRKGSIEVGKLADLVVLGEDILTIDPNRIMDIPIEQTIIAGKVVFDGQAPAP